MMDGWVVGWLYYTHKQFKKKKKLCSIRNKFRWEGERDCSRTRRTSMYIMYLACGKKSRQPVSPRRAQSSIVEKYCNKIVIILRSTAQLALCSEGFGSALFKSIAHFLLSVSPGESLVFTVCRACESETRQAWTDSFTHSRSYAPTYGITPLPGNECLQ